MNLVIAVSGGVDSVVLLHMLARQKDRHRLIVAHFDHGIREESQADERFVAALAASYGLMYVSERQELGLTASEALARERRYTFLQSVADKFNARIITAHHQDDLLETIAINILRGTGWRGLAVFGNERIVRPLIHYSKAALYDYALRHSLEWVQDETNHTSLYLRNRVRFVSASMPETTRKQLVLLWQQQRLLRRSIDQDVVRVSLSNRRYDFIMWPESVAIEVLRSQTESKLTRPQLQSLLHAIKTIRPHATLEVGSDIIVRFSTREFIVENTGEML